MKTKSLLAAVTAFLSLAASGLADEVTVSGNTQGRFDAQSFAATNTLGGLTFTGEPGFSDTTSGGDASYNLGTFSLIAPPAFTYTGHTFDLRITFTAPPNTLGNPGIFSATLTGVVTATKGGVFINFVNSFGNPQNFTFSFMTGLSTTTGSFDFYVNPISVPRNGGAVTLTGGVTNASQTTTTPAVPDSGATVSLLGIALAGIEVVRRRLKAA